MNLQILFWILSLQLGSLLGLESGPSQEHESISVANGEQLVSYRPSTEPRIYRKEMRHSHRDPSRTWSVLDLLRPSGLSIYGPSSGPTGSGGSTGGGGSGAAGFGPGFGTGFGTSSHEIVHSDSRETSAEHYHSSEKKNCIECPFPFVEVGNNCYFSPNCTSNPTLSWPSSRLYCQGQLGVASDLAVFNDTNQYIDALNYIRFRDSKSLCSYWIGGSNVNGTFQWITGGYVPLGTPLWGFTSSGTQYPTNIGTNIYAFLNNADFYRVGNVAASATSIPLCQYVASCKSNRGANSGGTTSGSGSTSTGGSGSGSVVNTVVNQEGSSYHSLQNITFVNEPLINVTSDFNSTAPSPLNITVFPPEITYYYYDAYKVPHQCQYQTKGNCVPTPLYNYNPGSLPPTYTGGNNFNWVPFRQGSNIPAMGSYVTTRESNVPTGSNVPLSGSYVTTRESNVPMGSNVPNVGYNAPVTGHIDSAHLAQPQQHYEISYHPLYARILNTMKTLMDKIESNSHQSEEGPVNSAVELLAKNSLSP